MVARGGGKAQRPDWFGGRSAPLRPLDAERACAFASDIAEAARDAGCPRLAALLSGRSELAGFLQAVFDLSDFSELLAYLRPGASFHVAEHVCEALFPAGADGPADLEARCGSWARDRQCIPCRSPLRGEIVFTKTGGAAGCPLPPS